MIRRTLIIAVIAALCGCATGSLSVTQESVTETSFEGSYLYEKFRESRSEGPLIPGLVQDLVPQGMAVHEDMIIISNYSSAGKAGTIAIVNLESGSFEKILYLKNDDGSDHTGHLGGLAAGSKNLWISSGKGVYYLPYPVLMEAMSGDTLQLPPIILTETKGSFATFHNGYVWIGEFTRSNGDYPVPQSHWRIRADGKKNRAWLGAYLPENLLKSRESHFPDKIYSIPDEVQGAAFADDYLYLSMSYGRKNYSRLETYRRLDHEEPHEVISPGNERETALWILDETSLIGNMDIPPMSEAVVKQGDDLYVLFESGASKYRDTALFPLDKIQLVPQKALGDN